MNKVGPIAVGIFCLAILVLGSCSLPGSGSSGENVEAAPPPESPVAEPGIPEGTEMQWVDGSTLVYIRLGGTPGVWLMKQHVDPHSYGLCAELGQCPPAADLADETAAQAYCLWVLGRSLTTNEADLTTGRVDLFPGGEGEVGFRCAFDNPEPMAPMCKSAVQASYQIDSLLTPAPTSPGCMPPDLTYAVYCENGQGRAIIEARPGPIQSFRSEALECVQFEDNRILCNGAGSGQVEVCLACGAEEQAVSMSCPAGYEPGPAPGQCIFTGASGAGGCPPGMSFDSGVCVSLTPTGSGTLRCPDPNEHVVDGVCVSLTPPGSGTLRCPDPNEHVVDGVCVSLTPPGSGTLRCPDPSEHVVDGVCVSLTPPGSGTLRCPDPNEHVVDGVCRRDDGAAHPDCQQGTYYDPQLNACVSLGEPLRSTCLAGYAFDESQGCCSAGAEDSMLYPGLYPACPAGTFYNQLTRACEPVSAPNGCATIAVTLPVCSPGGAAGGGQCKDYGDKDQCTAAGCSWDPAKLACN